MPAVSEAGYPAFDVKSWYALVAPAGTPPWIIARLNADFTRALQSDDIKGRLGELGVEVKPSSAADLAILIDTEYEKWDKVLKSAKIPMIN